LIRSKLVEEAHQRGKELTINNEFYFRWLGQFFDREYAEDVGSQDLTSKALLIGDREEEAVLKSKHIGVVGGVEEVSWFFRTHGLEVNVHVKDGAKVRKGETVLGVRGAQKELLATERIGLNVLQRMSGIATETRNLVELIKHHDTRIAATRKTPLRYLDKKAVFLGGGLTHRFGLWDSILIKDNHLRVLQEKGIGNYIERAIDMASAFSDEASFLEIEATNEDEALRAAGKFRQLKLKKPCIVMLDNMSPSEIKQTIMKLKEKSLYDNVLLEASGNISRKNIVKYAETEVDVISLGYLTHSVTALDMSLEMT
jgi:nicotinate-nucleotide pyrophosphorylase (carboxylating)